MSTVVPFPRQVHDRSEIPEYIWWGFSCKVHNIFTYTRCTEPNNLVNTPIVAWSLSVLDHVSLYCSVTVDVRSRVRRSMLHVVLRFAWLNSGDMVWKDIRWRCGPCVEVHWPYLSHRNRCTVHGVWSALISGPVTTLVCYSSSISNGVFECQLL